MKKVSFVTASLMLSFVIGCASAPEPQPVKKDTAAPKVADISSQNQQLSGQYIGGFAYKSAKLDTAAFDRWAVKAAPIVKDIIAKLPDGYVLQITGHTDASGPEQPEGDKPGNIKISTDRAKAVYDALKRAGIDSPKITYAGIGSQELYKAFSPRDPIQRRVTFKIVQE